MSLPVRYTRIAVWLHGLIGLSVMAQIGLGLWMLEIPKAPPGLRAYWFNVHKSIGLSLAFFIVLRIVWRWYHVPPQLPVQIPNWQALASKITHKVLYVCMITMPVTGYLGSSFTQYPIKYFGWTLPYWGWDAPAYKALCSQIHYVCACTLICLIAVHVLAAIKHLFNRDGIFQRMWH